MIKDLKNKFGKSFHPPHIPPHMFTLFKEIQGDEIILTDQLTVDQGQEILLYIKESDKYKKYKLVVVPMQNQPI